MLVSIVTFIYDQDFWAIRKQESRNKCTTRHWWVCISRSYIYSCSLFNQMVVLNLIYMLRVGSQIVQISLDGLIE